MTQTTTHITFGEARTLAANLLEKTGMPWASAWSTARAIVLAEVWGLHSHGFLRLPIYLERLRAGGYPPDAILEPVRDSGATLVYDGHAGLGHWQITEALDVAIPRARQYGIALTAIGNSGHCGALGVYVADAAEAGMVSLLFSSGPPALPAWGSATRLLSTSPMAAGFPHRPRPIIVDTALSAVSRGKVAEHAATNTPLPEGWAVDRDGVPTTDPQAALTGMLAPMAGVKGFALAYMVEALAAGLVGPALSKEMPDIFDPASYGRAQLISHLLITIDPTVSDVSGRADGPTDRLGGLVDATVAAGSRPPGARRMAPGEVTTDLPISIDTAILERLREELR